MEIFLGFADAVFGMSSSSTVVVSMTLGTKKTRKRIQGEKKVTFYRPLRRRNGDDFFG